MKEEYLFLEALRQTGVVNMFQAARYIPMFFPKYDESSSVKCLAEWMDKPKDYTDYEEQIQKYKILINRCL